MTSPGTIVLDPVPVGSRVGLLLDEPEQTAITRILQEHGYEVATAIENCHALIASPAQWGVRTASVPVILLGTPQALAQSTAADLFGHVATPLDFRPVLTRLLGRALQAQHLLGSVQRAARCRGLAIVEPEALGRVVIVAASDTDWADALDGQRVRRRAELHAVTTEGVGVVVVEGDLPDMEPDDVIEILRRRSGDPELFGILVLAEEWDETDVASTLDLGDVGFLFAPVTAVQLHTAVRSALQVWQRRLQLGRVLHERARVETERRSHGSRALPPAHDLLTGLASREALLGHLERAIGRARRDPSHGFALISLDIDDFSALNDKLGDEVGDEVLQEVGRRLLRACRGYDLVARVGGDEFLLLLEGTERLYDTRIVRRLQRALNAPLRIGKQIIEPGASFGITSSARGYRQAEAAVRDADLAMARAKGSGKRRYAIFDHELHAQHMDRLQLEADLRDALDNDLIDPFFQPIFTIADGGLVGFEALARWRHPQRGILLPDQFLGLSSEAGLLVDLGRAVLRKACAEAQRWHQAGARPFLSVNMSAGEILEPGLVEDVMAAAGRAGLAPSDLHVELTEDEAIENFDGTSAVVRRLRGLGIRCDLDDFGAGYSSLKYLHMLNVDALKIDRTFTADRPTSRHTQAIVRSVVGLARELGLGVIAEGIETAEHLRAVRLLDIPLGQGFYLGRPLSGEAALCLVDGPQVR
jgi:diguanylate cyclase (GGDEF)-like protein